jgi:hypothetical protein
MTPEELFNLRRLPGRLVEEEAAALLGFKRHDVPVLVRSRLLRPLGNPSRNAVKYFATAHLLKLADDPAWLDRATKEIARNWQRRNRQGRGDADNSLER